MVGQELGVRRDLETGGRHRRDPLGEGEEATGRGEVDRAGQRGGGSGPGLGGRQAGPSCAWEAAWTSPGQGPMWG